MVHEGLERLPGIKQSHAGVVKDFAVLISRILLVPRLKRKRSVNEIEIRIVEAESLQTRLESGLDALGPMIGVPQLCRNKDVFTRNSSSGKSCLERFAYLTLVPVSFRTIEVSKPGFQCVFGSTDRDSSIGNQGAKPECGH